ncbi:unnamed protein product [Psylliodes chrysocephalus]|uniref:Uncharacterized protein n=1 Tax=Psylliodes chrysocephalus TaxID=3402493 RepID=A0A9P0G8Y7_9CUCU|nr:unnamed protein product [Psylliodes chrysocephala]
MNVTSHECLVLDIRVFHAWSSRGKSILQLALTQNESSEDVNSERDNVIPSTSRDVDRTSPMELLEDNDDSDADPLFNPEEETESESEPDADRENLSNEAPLAIITSTKAKRAKRGRASKDNWTSEKQRIKRNKGEEYFGRRKTEQGKIIFDVPRASRQLKPRCSHTISTFFKCSSVSDNLRQEIFTTYWKMSRQEKKCFVKALVLKKGVKQRRTVNPNSRRGNSFQYHLKDVGTTFHVCKKMFLHTLAIGEWTVHAWVGIKDKISTTRNPVIKANENANRQKVHDFLDSLPKLEAHYCRKDTAKLYLEPMWQSKSKLYTEYFLDLNIEQQHSVSKFVFWQIFDEMNFALFRPKEDQCDICCGYRTKNVTEISYNRHIERKDEARNEKDKDKANQDPSVVVFTIDLQAVLLCPFLKASALYYKTKLLDIPYVNSIRPGNRVGDPVVVDLCAIQYHPEGTMQVKKKFSDSYEDLHRRIKKPDATDNFMKLYTRRNSIKIQKFNHLQELKMVIPKDIHSFYDELPH